MKIRRRTRWIVVGTALLALAAGLILVQPGLVVVVYNSTNEPFRRVSVSVGADMRQKESLQPRESIAFPFKKAPREADVRLVVDADPTITWRAPSLARPDVCSITLRVDEFGGVTHTVEKSWDFSY